MLFLRTPPCEKSSHNECIHERVLVRSLVYQPRRSSLLADLSSYTALSQVPTKDGLSERRDSLFAHSTTDTRGIPLCPSLFRDPQPLSAASGRIFHARPECVRLATNVEIEFSETSSGQAAWGPIEAQALADHRYGDYAGPV